MPNRVFVDLLELDRHGRVLYYPPILTLHMTIKIVRVWLTSDKKLRLLKRLPVLEVISGQIFRSEFREGGVVEKFTGGRDWPGRTCWDRFFTRDISCI